MNKNNIFRAIFQIFFPLLVGSIVGLIISNNIDYEVLRQPPLSPPSWLFPVVWSILYLLMGISYYLYNKNTGGDEKVSKIYYLQLFVNALWSIIFFVWKLRFFAIVWIIILIILVVYLFILYYRDYKFSAYLLIPYIIWLLFAAYLNIGVYLLN